MSAIPGLTLDILITPTYNTLTLAVTDASIYPQSPAITSPTLTVGMPGFDPVVLTFTRNTTNVLNSQILGLTQAGQDLLPLPDGIYTFNYSVAPAIDNNVNKTFMRTDVLQEKFDEAFMQLDMMECDLAIKKQDKVDLTSIYFLIQGSIAAANNCATNVSMKLYNQAYKMLNNFMKNGCKCSGNNYIVNFKY